MPGYLGGRKVSTEEVPAGQFFWGGSDVVSGIGRLAFTSPWKIHRAMASWYQQVPGTSFIAQLSWAIGCARDCCQCGAAPTCIHPKGLLESSKSIFLCFFLKLRVAFPRFAWCWAVMLLLPACLVKTAFQQDAFLPRIGPPASSFSQDKLS